MYFLICDCRVEDKLDQVVGEWKVNVWSFARRLASTCLIGTHRAHIARCSRLVTSALTPLINSDHIPIPPQNIHNVLFNHPEQAHRPGCILHINALSGQTRSFRQFLERVRDGATAMSADADQGGLGIRPGNNELVGLLTENSMVLVS